MRRIAGNKTIADLLVDRRSSMGHNTHDAINRHSPRERVVFAEGHAEINQGIPGESERGNTGHVGQERESIEDEDDGKTKKKGRPSPAHAG